VPSHKTGLILENRTWGKGKNEIRESLRALFLFNRKCHVLLNKKGKAKGPPLGSLLAKNTQTKTIVFTCVFTV
jgi:hypothetical protein